MQAISKDIYQNAALKSGIDISLIKSVGDAVFNALFNYFRDPPNIVCKLKGIGYWYMRKARLDTYLHKFNTYFTTTPDSKEPGYLAKYQEDKKHFLLLTDRKTQYDVFLEKKRVLREIRHKTQPFVTPINKEEC